MSWMSYISLSKYFSFPGQSAVVTIYIYDTMAYFGLLLYLGANNSGGCSERVLFCGHGLYLRYVFLWSKKNDERCHQPRCLCCIDLVPIQVSKYLFRRILCFRYNIWCWIVEYWVDTIYVEKNAIASVWTCAHASGHMG
jgi:hypothetical protein